SRRSRVKRVHALATIALAFGLLVGLAGPAEAHAAVVASSPGDGDLLPSSPKQVVLKFSERVDVKTAAINIETASKTVLQTRRPTRWQNDPTALVVPVERRLGGSYVLFWRVVGQD